MKLENLEISSAQARKLAPTLRQRNPGRVVHDAEGKQARESDIEEDDEIDRVGKGVDASGQTLQGMQPRTLQHDLLIVVFWLAVALGFFYWIA